MPAAKNIFKMQNNSFQSSDSTEHLRIYAGEDPYHCDSGFKADNKCLETHLQMHTGDPPNGCDTGLKAFVNDRESLKKHISKYRLPRNPLNVILVLNQL